MLLTHIMLYAFLVHFMHSPFLLLLCLLLFFFIFGITKLTSERFLTAIKIGNLFIYFIFHFIFHAFALFMPFFSSPSLLLLLFQIGMLLMPCDIRTHDC